jgi:hypothetical protein
MRQRARTVFHLAKSHVTISRFNGNANRTHGKLLGSFRQVVRTQGEVDRSQRMPSRSHRRMSRNGFHAARLTVNADRRPRKGGRRRWQPAKAFRWTDQFVPAVNGSAVLMVRAIQFRKGTRQHRRAGFQPVSSSRKERAQNPSCGLQIAAWRGWITSRRTLRFALPTW